ncbi:MAG TPA: VCBS repeat-containing protein, partial [Cyclobacteriaceae bacterium]
VDANQLLHVSYTDAGIRKWTKPTARPVFQEDPHLLAKSFVHRENRFNEYKEQILLPHMFSKSGPFVATGDVNGDGADDFYVGGAAGQPGALYVREGDHWTPRYVEMFEADKAFEDMGVAFIDADSDGDLDLYVVSGGSEFSRGSSYYRDRLYVNDGKGNFRQRTFLQTVSSGSCILPFDADGDGDVDIFRGGQVTAGAYPKPPDSYLFMNEGGSFVDKTEAMAPDLSRVGMVKSAVAADLDGDRALELIVTGEWMPVRVFALAGTAFRDVTSKYGLEYTEGWWNKVVADDLDGDGDTDLILGNIGENYKFTASREKPFQVFAGDFDGNGTNDIFLAKYLKDSVLVPIRGRECTSQQMPVIAQKFPTFTSFAESDLPAIIGAGLETAINLKAYQFSSVIMVNQSGHFETKRLPTLAQLSAVNGIIVKDFDGDGIKDLLLGGNKFDTEVETTPADASPGLFLRGGVDLSYTPVRSFESGFFVPFNVKDIRLVQDGSSAAVLVTVNDGTLRIFRNVRETGMPTASR